MSTRISHPGLYILEPPVIPAPVRVEERPRDRAPRGAAVKPEGWMVHVSQDPCRYQDTDPAASPGEVALPDGSSIAGHYLMEMAERAAAEAAEAATQAAAAAERARAIAAAENQAIQAMEAALTAAPEAGPTDRALVVPSLPDPAERREAFARAPAAALTAAQNAAFEVLERDPAGSAPARSRRLAPARPLAPSGRLAPAVRQALVMSIQESTRVATDATLASYEADSCSRELWPAVDDFLTLATRERQAALDSGGVQVEPPILTRTSSGQPGVIDQVLPEGGER